MVPLGYYCYKLYPLFKGHAFFLNNHIYEKRVPLPDKGTIDISNLQHKVIEWSSGFTEFK